MTPGRQPKHTMDSLTTNKRERLDREGWEALGALRELPELSRPEEPVSTVVSGPLHFHRATAPLWGFGLPARSPQRLFGYVVLSLLPPNKGSKQDQQGASTALRRPCRELLLPPLLLGASAHARPQAASRAGLPGSWGLHRGCFYMGPFWVQQTRESGQRCWIATGLSGDCRSSLGLEGRGGVIDYHPFHFHRACQVSIQVLWPTCKVQADFGQDKGGKQKPQGVTARTWLPHPEPLLLGRPMPQAPYTPD